MAGDRIATAVLELVTDATKLDAGLAAAKQQAGTQLAGIGTSLQGFGQAASSIGAGLLPISLAVAGIGVAAVTMATEFNASMANIASLIPGNTARVNELKGAVQTMAVELGKSTDDLAGGLYQVISAFGDSADSVKILDLNARAAAAGLATTTEAINLTSAVTKGYGDTSAEAVARASDLALLTVRLGQTTFPELAGAIGKVVPLTSALKISQEELFGVMATATGVTGNAAEVSTQLRGVMQGLMQPTEAMGGLFEILGVKSGQALIEQRGLQGAINAIVAAADASGLPLGKFLGSIEGQTLAMALAGPQAATLTEKITAMNGAAGATDAAFAEQTSGVNAAGFAWAQFKQQLVVAGQQLGDVILPVVMDAAEKLKPLWAAVQDLVKWFAQLPEPVKTVAVGLLALIAAAGPVLVALGMLASAIGAIIALPAIGTIAAIAGAIVGLGAVVLGAVAAWAKWGDDIKRIVSETYTAVKTWLWDKLEPIFTPIGGLLQSVGRLFEALRDLIGAVLGVALQKVGEFVSGVASWLRDQLSPVIDPALALFRSIATVVGEVARNAITFAQQLYEGVKGWLLDKFTAIVDGLKAKIDAVTGFFQDLKDKVVGHSSVPELTEGVLAQFKTMGEGMKKHTEEAVLKTQWYFSDLLRTATVTSGQIGAVVVPAFAGLRDVARGLTEDGLLPAAEGLQRMKDRTEEADREARELEQAMGGWGLALPPVVRDSGLLNQEVEKSPGIFDRLRSAAVTATGLVPGSFSSMRDQVGTILQGLPSLIDTIFSGGGGVLERLRSFGTQVVSAISGPLMAGLSQLQQTAVGWGQSLSSMLGSAAGGGLGGQVAGLASGLGGAALAASGWGASMAAAGVAGTVALGAATLGIGAAAAGIVALIRHFGGVSQAEKDARQSVAGFEDQLASTLDQTQRNEAGNERWKQTVIAVRDAYDKMGRTSDEALGDVKRLWDSSREGPEATQRVIDEITNKMRTEVPQAAGAATDSVEDLGDTIDDTASAAQDDLAWGIREPLEDIADQTRRANTSALQALQDKIADAARSGNRDLKEQLEQALINLQIKIQADEQEFDRLADQVETTARDSVGDIETVEAAAEDVRTKTGDAAGAFDGLALAAEQAAWRAEQAVGTGLLSSIDAIQTHLDNTDWSGFAQDAATAVQGVQGAIDRLNFGSSPGGLKEIPLQLERAIERMRAFGSLTRTELSGLSASTTGFMAPAAGRASTVSLSIAPGAIQITQQPGESSERLASRLIDEMTAVLRVQGTRRAHFAAALGV